MAELKHYIDFLDGAGLTLINEPPLEWKQLVIENIFDENEQRLSSGQLTWADDVALKIIEYFENGFTTPATTQGIFEALPYRITLECDGITYTIVDAGINLASEETEFSCDIIKAPIKERGKIDFLTTRADSFRFAYLASLSSSEAGHIGASDYIDIWYMDGGYPRKLQIIISSVTLFIILKEIYETIKRIADVIAATLGGLTGAAETAAQLISLVIYLAIMIVALIQLLNDLIDLIFPFVYYHRAMYVRTLCQKACAYLGFNFSSTIFASSSASYNQYVMPPKQTEGKKVGISSSEVGYYEGTFGDLLRALIEEYNAEVKIIGTTLYLERSGYFANMSTYRVPEEKSIEFYGTNASEVNSNYLIEYQYDKIDLNDYDASSGRLVQAAHSPIIVSDKKNVLLQGLQQREIPFTLVNVKISVSKLEIKMTNIFNAFAGLISAMASIFSSSGSGVPTIPSSINILNLDSHFISEHKTGIYLGSGTTDPNTASNIGARALLNNYHFVELIKPYGSASAGNQWYRYKGRVPLCCEDYLAIKDNNYGTYKGDLVRITSLKWTPYDEIADIEFEVNKLYTTNLKLTISEPYQPDLIIT